MSKGSKPSEPRITVRKLSWSDAILYVLARSLEEDQIVSEALLQRAVEHILNTSEGVVRYRTRGLRGLSAREVLNRAFVRWAVDGHTLDCIQAVEAGTVLRPHLAQAQMGMYCDHARAHLDPLVPEVAACLKRHEQSRLALAGV